MSRKDDNPAHAAQQALQQFLYTVSHDLSEPIRQVVSFGEILKEEEFSRLSDDGRLYLDAVIAAGSRMQDMLGGLLQISRVASRGQQFTLCDLGELIALELEALESQIEATGARLECGHLPTVEGDAAQLRVVLHQLLDNAFKFARPGVPPVIRIHAADDAEPGWMRLLVQDNGIGFDMLYAEKIFEVFQRLDPQSDRSGVGIGLSLCRSICDRHGGRISALTSSQQGTSICIELPLVQGGGVAPPRN
ncbi:MAG: hypothetical protein K0U79_12460 [Gammaproteobacteria bacterium]|nr:hypothetical protein [Gammaproteobacteria bacterium]